MRAARRRLEALSLAWVEIQHLGAVREVAQRLVDTRAADALQLGAAVVAAGGKPSSLPFLTLDELLGEIAEREGLRASEPI